MAIKPVLFHLTAEEALKLTRILFDEDKEEALIHQRMSQASIR